MEQVLADVPATQRCSCAADTSPRGAGSARGTGTAQGTGAARSGGLLSRLFGRSS